MSSKGKQPSAHPIEPAIELDMSDPIDRLLYANHRTVVSDSFISADYQEELVRGVQLNRAFITTLIREHWALTAAVGYAYKSPSHESKQILIVGANSLQTTARDRDSLKNLFHEEAGKWDFTDMAVHFMHSALKSKLEPGSINDSYAILDVEARQNLKDFYSRIAIDSLKKPSQSQY